MRFKRFGGLLAYNKRLKRLKFLQCTMTKITPHDSEGNLVFWRQSSRRNSNWIFPYGGDKYRWVG